jgi:hypothetical protein
MQDGESGYDLCVTEANGNVRFIPVSRIEFVEDEEDKSQEAMKKKHLTEGDLSLKQFEFLKSEVNARYQLNLDQMNAVTPNHFSFIASMNYGSLRP